MEDVHPSDRLRLAYLPEIHLGRLQILMSQDDFRYDLQGDTIPTGVSRRVPPQALWRYFAIQLRPQLFDH